MGDLYNQTVSPGGTNRNNFGGAVGNRFAPKSTVYVNTVSFYCAVDAGARPGFNLWNNTGALRLHKAAADVTWVGTAPGWFTYTLTEAESTSVGAVTGNTTWEVDLQVTSGGVTWRENCNTPDNTVEFSYEGARYGGGYPVIADNTATSPWGVSVGVSDSPAGGAGGGGSGGLTDADLAAWLSANSATNTHQTDLPWLTKTVADAIKNGTDALSHSGSGSTIDWIVALWKLAGNLTDLEYAAVRQFLKDGQARITGASGGGGSAFYGPGGTQVAAGVEEVLSQLSTLSGGLPAKVLQAGIGSLTPTDETDFTYQLAWNVPADVYVVHFTDWPGQREEVDVAGVTWLPRVAWWAPLEGSQPGQRRFLDFEYNQAHQLPVRSEGLLLRAKYVGVTGHVQAFVLP